MNVKVLHRVSYGIYIVCSRKNGKINGQIVNTVFQITSQPPQMGISINKQNLTHEFISSSKVFSIAILSRDTPPKFIGQFGFKSGREIDKFKGVNYKLGKTGAPLILDHTIGFIECEVVNSIDCGTHTMFIGKIVDAEIINENAEPLTYDFYHKELKLKVPKTATTYIEEK
ncbi:MAG: flavin reductase family protein [candidate division WOR-3 bacterium]|nr:flavin reductase family protein [candidate division WOR-3 bacterium]